MFILNVVLFAILSMAYAVPLTNITEHAAEVSPGMTVNRGKTGES